MRAECNVVETGAPNWGFVSSGWTSKRVMDSIHRIWRMIRGQVKGLIAFIADMFRSKGKWDGVGIGV